MFRMIADILLNKFVFLQIKHFFGFIPKRDIKLWVTLIFCRPVNVP